MLGGHRPEVVQHAAGHDLDGLTLTLTLTLTPASPNPKSLTLTRRRLIGAEVRGQVRDEAGEREQGLRQDDGGVYRVLGGLSGGGEITENCTSSPNSRFLV